MATFYLAKRWVRLGSRTRDQMEQSARSGKQNIVEGSLASATSKQTEIHLTNVARASLGELPEDYLDFLRLRGLPIWAKDDPRMLALRALGRDEATYETYRAYVESDDPEVVGNVMVCLCRQACYLLDQQIRGLEQAFLAEGGIRERMTRARLEVRTQQESPTAPAPLRRLCPLCPIRPLPPAPAPDGRCRGHAESPWRRRSCCSAVSICLPQTIRGHPATGSRPGTASSASRAVL